MHSTTRHLRAAVALGALLALSAITSACGSDSSEDEKPTPVANFTLDELRDADICPLEVDGDKLPEGIGLSNTDDVTVSDHDDGVEVQCNLPIDDSDADEEVHAIVAAAPDGTDLFEMETESGGSWATGVFNATGVDTNELADAAGDLSDVEVRVLEGNGESLALTQLAVDGADRALLVVYGDDARSGDELKAIAEALR